jgi:signal transduction histidine kinase/ligand-binding sensor domain-containing protein
MPSRRDQKLFAAFSLCVLVLILVTVFLGQELQISPTPPPSPTLSPSSTQTPSAKPTASPVPTALNFHQWGSITLFNGLPSDTVRAIEQTPDGVMWFGTDNGLARFDGRRIQNFSLGSPEANRVLALMNTGANSELWVGTRAGAFVHSNHGFEPVENTSGMAITAIVARRDDIWRPGTERDIVLGTESGMVLVVRRDENGGLVSTPLFAPPITSVNGIPVAVTGLIQTDHGGILAGTSGRGVFFVNDGSAENESTLPVRSPFVNAIVRDSNSTVWLGVDAARGASGIFAASPDKTPVRVSAPTSKVLTLAANDHGTWAGTERFGLFNFVDSKLKKAYTFANTSGGLRSDTIYALFTDREGVLWIGTNRGVSRFDSSGAFQETVSDIPNSNFIRSFYQMSDVRSYAGTNRGLFVKSEDRTWIEVPGLKNKVIYAITNRSGGQMIVGTPDGVFDIAGKKLFDGDVRGFASFDSRYYAAVYGRGVVDITGNTPQTVFADETVTSVCNLVGNRFWIGTAGRGLFSFDGKTVKSEAVPDVLKSGTIWNMFDTREGTLYIAGQHGVFTLRDGTVEQIIAAEEVRDVLSRDGQIWAATTTRGLLHARQDDRFGWLASSIGFEQGMPSEKAFLIRPNVADELAIATNRGIVLYKPGTVAPKLIANRVLSKKLHDLNEIGSLIELDYPQNSLQIEVAGQSSRTFPEEFQYAFVLTDVKGKELDRRISNESQYARTNLSPGDYAIAAIAFNRDLLASEPLAIRFSVANAPFPWTATALGILFAIALIAFIWAMIERRHTAMRNAELAAARFDLANEAENERSRIARDLHDQTLADLRNLLMMSDRLSPPNSEFRSEIESVSTEVRRICEDLSPSVLENVGLVAALEFLLSRSVQDHTFSTTEDANELVKFPVIEQLHIYRIAQEILTNVDRHSDATHIEMNVQVFADGRFLLTIHDNGHPFRPDSITRGRGLANIRSRASLINAMTAWDQPSAGGNLFKLEITGKSSV